MKKIVLLALLAFLSGCAGMASNGTADRLYVIDCGENHVKDLSRWTPGINVGQPFVFGDYCYLVKHGNDWMLWDSGNPDRLAALPDGLTNPAGTITAFMRKPLVESLKEIGLAPAGIQYFAMSHSHGDHSGNANLFAASTIFMQQAEYDAVFGAEPQKYGFLPANFEALKGAKIVKLNGDHDVFGDGSVVIKSTPGHTPGHQSLFVRLPRTGALFLTGDLAHLQYSWDNRIVPSFNFSVGQTGQSIDAMKEFAAKAHAKVLVNHDRLQQSAILKAPAYLE